MEKTVLCNVICRSNYYMALFKTFRKESVV